MTKRPKEQKWYYFQPSTSFHEPVELYTYEDACDLLKHLDPPCSLIEFHPIDRGQYERS